jgi:hypothetical protein
MVSSELPVQVGPIRQQRRIARDSAAGWIRTLSRPVASLSAIVSSPG